MKVSLSYIKRLIKQIPIGYYFGVKVPVTSNDEEDTSYYSLVNNTITISTKLITNACNNIPDGDFSEEKVEMIVRSIIYHELSHAMLTPTEMINVMTEAYQVLHGFRKDDTSSYSRIVDRIPLSMTLSEIKEIVNIVEDQRIETCTRNIYKNINYGETLRLVSSPVDFSTIDYKQIPVISLFFDFIRYCNVPRELTQEYGHLSNLFTKRRYLVTNSSLLPRSDMSIYKIKSYLCDIFDLYCDFEEFLKEFSENSLDDSSLSLNEESTSSVDHESSEEILEKLKQTTVHCESYLLGEDTGESLGKFPRLSDIQDSQRLLERSLKVQIEKTFALNEESRYCENKLREVLLVSRKSRSQQLSAKCSYSGVFNPRQVVREDYKYFLFRNFGGSAKLDSKLRLNLFIDRSGSFSDSVPRVNILLKCLGELKKFVNNFDFTLTTIGVGFKEINDLDKFQNFFANEGTYLTPDSFDVVKRKQSTDSINLNLLLIDGYAWWSAPLNLHRTSYRNAGAFNLKNTIIITDPSNREAFDTYAPLSRRIYVEKDYASVLIDNVVTSLKRVLPLLN